MEALETIYAICFFLGLGFAVLSAVLAGVFGGFDAGLDVGGDVGGVDGGDAGHFSPWNPTIIAMFLGSFGGAGMICQRAGLTSPFVQLPIALSAGFGVGAVTFWLMLKFFQGAKASSEVKLADVIGKEAEVTVGILPGEVGQIVYIMGGRHLAQATAVDRAEIPTGSNVKIRKIVGTTFYVERIP